MSGHGGVLALDAARRHGVRMMFTLSGGHVFPLYDAATRADPPVRLIDVRHEQTAVFAAEATARLTRVPGLAVVTAGPGVTNSVSAIVTAHFNGAPVVVLGGRAPDYRWGAGSLQEIDHPPLLAPVTKRAWTEHATAQVAASVGEAFRLAATPHRGPVFLDVSLEALYGKAEAAPLAPGGVPARAAAPDAAAVSQIAGLLAGAERPVLVLGSDVWMDGAEAAARDAAEQLGIPVIANGQGRGILPAGHPLLVTRARSAAFREADLVLVAGAPLDFRLGYGQFGQGEHAARVVHVADSAAQLASHCPLAAAAAGDLTAFFTGLAAELAGASSTASSGPGGQAPGRQAPGRQAAARRREWLARLQEITRAAIAADAGLLASDAQPIHPMRVYGELTRQLADDAVVIGDGGDFVLVRRQVCGTPAAGALARSRSVRLPGHGPGVRDRGSAGPALGSGSAAARRRRGGLFADGRGHPGPARAAGGHGVRQQWRLGAGEASDARAVRLRRRRRPAAGLPLRRGGACPRRRR